MLRVDVARARIVVALVAAPCWPGTGGVQLRARGPCTKTLHRAPSAVESRFAVTLRSWSMPASRAAGCFAPTLGGKMEVVLCCLFVMML